jgi:hypothetical protein
MLARMRGPGYILKDVGPYGLWTTLVIRPLHPTDRPIRGFNFSIGQEIPGLSKVIACRSDTNLAVAGCLVDETMHVDSVSWHIPAISLEKYQAGVPAQRKDYFVTPADVEEVVRNARLTVHTDKGDIAIPLIASKDAIGGHGATHVLEKDAFDFGRLRGFWVELTFAKPPMLNGNLAIIVTLNGLRTRGVQ